MKVTITDDWFIRYGAKPYLEVGRTYDVNDLVHHENYNVRYEAAAHGYSLDVLVNDENSWVHEEVSDYLKEHGYKSVFEWAKDNGIDIDINEWLHSDYAIKRKQVVKCGYRLDILVNDKSADVRYSVANYLKEHGYKSVFEWAKENGVNIDIDEWLYSDDNKKREEVVRHGYRLDILVNDESADVRMAVARQGYSLDILVNDESRWVREAVAEQGYGLDVLINDKDWHVRLLVAEQGYGLDVLINDKISSVRAAVARQGYGLDILINDEDSDVRTAVAKQGYGLDVLIKDKDKNVRGEVNEYLYRYGYKSVKDWAIFNPGNVHGTIDTKTTDGLKDFVYKVNDSNSLKVESSYESVDDFFNDSSKESYESNEALVILTVDTKIPLIKLEKSIKDDKQVYKFIVDITNEDGGSFNVKSVITSNETFSQLLQSTIESLSLYPQFSKYADDLENCL